MNERRSDPPFPFAVFYPLAAVLVVLPFADVMIGLVPPRFSDVQWRVGALGLLTGAMMFPLLGFVLALVAAHSLEHRWVQRILEGLYALIGVVLIGLIALFALDAIQIRRDVGPAAKRAFDMAVGKGALMQLLLGGMLLILAAVSFRRRRAFARREERHRRADGPNIPVVGALKS